MEYCSLCGKELELFAVFELFCFVDYLQILWHFCEHYSDYVREDMCWSNLDDDRSCYVFENVLFCVYGKVIVFYVCFWTNCTSFS